MPPHTATRGPSSHPTEYKPPNQQRPTALEHDQYHSYEYMGPGESVNIKERGFPPSKVKLPTSSSRAKLPERRVRFRLEPVEEDVVAKGRRDDALDAPIPCDPINCPEARLALENACLPHALPLEASSSTGPSTSYGAAYRRHYKGDSSNTATWGRESFSYPNSFPGSAYNHSSTKALGVLKSASASNRRTPCSQGYTNDEAFAPDNPRRAPTRHRQFPSRPPAHIAEVEGDNEFPAYNDPRYVAQSLADLEISPLTSSGFPNSHRYPCQNFSNRDQSWAGHDRHISDGSITHAPELSPGSTTKKSKEIFKKLLGGRISQPADTNIYPFITKSEGSQSIRYVNLESRKEWAFVAVSPDTRTVVGVCDRECFMTYSMDLTGESAGVKMLVCGGFEGEPLAIAVSNRHLAILTLTKLQVFDHHNSRKVYEWSSDKSIAAENFTSIVFANSGLELCAGLTNGTIQFHYIPSDQQDYDPDDITFHRGDPRMDIALSSGDYAFTMAFSDDDMQFVCGTQKRMLLVYEFRGATGWELRNKFKFNDWV
ncbi:hypothetical protein ABW21_db0204569 [Orbilia brochopaga]|nr:hypothetical protein ABW21_db0204569 [Drechslerella brochopaga]